MQCNLQTNNSCFVVIFFLGAIVATTLGCSSVGLVQSSYKEVYVNGLGAALEESLPEGCTVEISSGDRSELEFVGSGFLLSDRFSSRTWLLDLGWIYQNYSPYSLDFTVERSGQSVRILSDFEVNSSSLEMVGGYVITGGFVIRAGLRRTLYTMMDTNYLSGVGVIEIVQNQGVVGFEYIFGKGNERTKGIYLRADYSLGLEKDSNVKSASSLLGALGYVW